MTEEDKRPEAQPYSLEELNQQFSRDIKNIKKRKGMPVVWLIVLLVVVVLIVVLIVWMVKPDTQSTGGNTTDAATTDVPEKDTAAADSSTDDGEPAADNESTLSEEEQEKWTATDPDGENVYVELNSKIYLDGSKAYIRLINPIYSTYYYSITIYPEGAEDTTLYQSEKIAPGTILEAAMLTTEPTEEQYGAVVKYLVYDEEGNELGTHPVHVEFTTDEQYK